MPNKKQKAKDPLPDYATIAKQYAAAKRRKELEDAAKSPADIAEETENAALMKIQKEALQKRRKGSYDRRWWWTVGFWVCILVIHVVGILFFAGGFLLTRLVLNETSECALSPASPSDHGLIPHWDGQGTIDGGCWHPKSFNKAVIVLIDALRYDFTVPINDDAKVYHNALTYLYESSINNPQNAFLRPFIADPPTSTLQRLQGLTTGTLPTFVDVGSSFAGTAIEEDNILLQLRNVGKRVAHLGDDTWWALFPDYLEKNISRAYDSFNVWDLHTVDNGVMEHIFPLLQTERRGEWDLLVGHLLGVDHAGHRYGPDHTAMREKLKQMDLFLRDLVTQIDDDTLLVVMGDHGMDSKGDHGGESEDEVEAALWMYSKRPFFGRTQPEFATPPATAKTRPVAQIDLVPTLSLLLGIPIPFNNLGKPIEEAFAGVAGNAWDILAAASHVTSSAIQRYQSFYFAARGVSQSKAVGSPKELWEAAENLRKTSKPNVEAWQATYSAYTRFQEETLQVCKGLWARFDVPKMITGIVIMALGVVALVLYASQDEEEDFAILENVELDMAETAFEAQGIAGDSGPSYQTAHRSLVLSAIVGAAIGATGGGLPILVLYPKDWVYVGAAAILGCIFGLLTSLTRLGKPVTNLLPGSVWGWMAATFTLSQSIGFASNSYTIWEDSILLFFLGTFGLVAAASSLGLESRSERTLGVYHSIMFSVLSRLASVSKLCREEQMPYCTSTYYASSTSSTSAPWQLVIPFAVALILPSIIRSFMMASRSYEGLAPTWIGTAYRGGLLMAATYWLLDTASVGNWFPAIRETVLKSISVYWAQMVLGIALVAGSTAFVWAPPCVSVFSSTTKSGSAQVTILGYGNAHGARYLLLPLNLLAACILLSKPMGGGALGLMLWQALSLVEILELNNLTSEAIGPVMLALLGNFHFFKTGHQAVLSSIQWDSAFIALSSIRYPWSALAVMMNTFAGQILAISLVPLIVMWKVGPKRKGVLESVSRALGAFVAYFATESLATMMWAGYLRRHLMLYRVFSPRFMTGVAILLVVDLMGILISLVGTRTNTFSISEVFGWAD